MIIKQHVSICVEFQSAPAYRVGMGDDREFFTTHQAAKLLNVSIRAIQLWMDSGQLTGWVSPGGHRRIEKASVMQMLKVRSGAQRGMPSLRKSVLVVEDDRDLTFLYRMNFKKWDFPVDLRFANDGFMALIEMGKQQPDLLITDLFMPNMDGFRMLESVNEAGMEVPTIVITGASERERATLQESDENLLVLGKPVDFNLLRRLVATTLDIRSQRSSAGVPATE